MFPFRIAHLAAATLFLLTPVGHAAAQAPRGDVEAPSPPAPALLPPRLLAAADAPYPPEALAARAEGDVVLLLTIDAAGTVLAAEIAQRLLPALDEAARRAALASRFTPATRDGTPTAARIRFTWSFQLPPGAISGYLAFADAEGIPATGIDVGLHDEAGSSWQTRTEADGRFQFDGLRHGRYLLRAGSPQIGTAEGAVTVDPGATVEPTLRLLPPDDQAALEVTVEGQSEADKLRESAQAVQVVETGDDKRRTADLGEILARASGISVRRDGGLGSGGRFALNGFEGDQVRFFLDGVPLELAGYPFGLANVPVNLVDRIEVYRGVVPVRFGADALGGAVNLVSNQIEPGSRGSASYQLGSFGTHRATLGGSHLFDSSGILVSAGGFFDTTRNDYEVDGEIVDSLGATRSYAAERFNDGYRAAGGNAQAGFVDRPWARRLLLRAFVTDYAKELQHDALMATPYGEVEYGGLTAGTTLRYEHELGGGVTVDLLGGYSFTDFWLLDESACTYTWAGECLAGTGRVAELGGVKQDATRRDRTTFARLNLGWEIAPGHALRISTSPTFFDRDGDNRHAADTSDPLRRRLSTETLVTGVEYEVDLFDDRLENVFFIKDYRQNSSGDAARIGGAVVRAEEMHRTGVGNALRYRLTDRLVAKASWEWATRMPSPDELFGDGVLVDEQLELRPETSHNVNVGATLEGVRTSLGSFRGDANLFLREATDLISRLFENNRMRHENVGEARALGTEFAAGWSAPNELFAIDGNLTWLDFRNTSGAGTYERQAGDRIPNQPWLFANAALRMSVDRMAGLEDRVELVWNARYVAQYYRGWESDGRRDSKEFVPEQVLHAAAATWDTAAGAAGLSFAAEVQNLFGATVFDSFGTQRPGRAFFFKTTAAY